VSPRHRPCRAVRGVGRPAASVATMTASTWSSPIVRLAPGRGSSNSPSRRRQPGRRRHLPTAASLTRRWPVTSAARRARRTCRDDRGPDGDGLGAPVPAGELLEGPKGGHRLFYGEGHAPTAKSLRRCPRWQRHLRQCTGRPLRLLCEGGRPSEREGVERSPPDEKGSLTDVGGWTGQPTRCAAGRRRMLRSRHVGGPIEVDSVPGNLEKPLTRPRTEPGGRQRRGRQGAHILHRAGRPTWRHLSMGLLNEEAALLMSRGLAEPSEDTRTS